MSIVPYGKHYIDQDDIKNVIKVLKSKKLENILLKKFKDFHIKFS